MSVLFSPLKIRDAVLKNRIVVSPMCQYSSEDGMPADWHFVHLGSRAVGGAAVVIMEATAVSPEGRISPDDAGIWNENQADAYKRINLFIFSQKSLPGIQLAHAGRKASTYSPWKGKGAVDIKNGGWKTIAPGAVPFAENYPVPKEMSIDDIQKVILDYKTAAERSIRAGFRIIELHMAHGYLIHQFYSPITNHRNDEYGGNLKNRCRLALEITTAVRNIIPENMPLFVRISSTDWVKNGWDLEQSIQLAKWLKEAGADLIDCSSGGNIESAKIPAGPGYQVSFAERIKKETGMLTGAVGLITSPVQAENIIRTNQSDVVILARELLRNPYWPFYAAKELKVDMDWPVQYLRAKQ